MRHDKTLAPGQPCHRKQLLRQSFVKTIGVQCRCGTQQAEPGTSIVIAPQLNLAKRCTLAPTLFNTQTRSLSLRATICQVTSVDNVAETTINTSRAETAMELLNMFNIDSKGAGMTIFRSRTDAA